LGRSLIAGQRSSVLRTLGHAHPGVHVEVRVGLSRELRDLVDDALLDAAIVFDDPKGRSGVPLARRRALGRRVRSGTRRSSLSTATEFRGAWFTPAPV
jgi:DNA-binding transcriptional LysR family regulator